MTEKPIRPPSPKDGEICELCGGTGKSLSMHSPRKGHPDFGSLHCAACGGTGRIKKKPEPK
jgi:hypothetical protein